MLNFDLLKKGLGIVSPPNFVYDFSRKMFHKLFYILTKFDRLIAFTSWDVGHLVSLIKPFSYMTKYLRQKNKYLENEKSF